MRILIVDDDPDIVVAISKILRASNYTVDQARTTIEADELVFVEEFDLIILDRRLPDRDGVEFCADLRSAGTAIPILMLTVLSEPEQRIDGLDAGADDYLAKPFHIGEFLARVRTLLRRQSDTRAPELAAGSLSLHPARREVMRGEERIALLPKEFAILEYLMRHLGLVRTQEQIGENIWGVEYAHGSNIIESYISRLRRKIEREDLPRLIHTIKGVGYRVMGDA